MTHPQPSPGPTSPLERRVERLTATVAVLAVGLGLAMLWQFVPRPVSSASRFVLRGPHGESRGSMELDSSNNPTLRLNDVSGRAMLYAVVIADGTTRLRLADSTGMSRVVFEVAPDGTPHAWLLDSAGRTGIHARVDRDDRPVLDLRWHEAWRQITLDDSTAAPAVRPRDGASRGR